MIVGLGTDIVRVERIAQSMERYGEHFLEKVFTPEERRYCNSRPNRAERYAVRFAAKEAFSKAIGTGWSNLFGWKDVSVVHNQYGKPELLLKGTLAEVWSVGYRLHLSLSHTSDTAMATVIIETTE